MYRGNERLGILEKMLVRFGFSQTPYYTGFMIAGFNAGLFILKVFLLAAYLN